MYNLTLSTSGFIALTLLIILILLIIGYGLKYYFKTQTILNAYEKYVEQKRLNSKKDLNEYSEVFLSNEEILELINSLDCFLKMYLESSYRENGILYLDFRYACRAMHFQDYSRKSIEDYTKHCIAKYYTEIRKFNLTFYIRTITKNTFCIGIPFNEYGMRWFNDNVNC